MFDTSTKHAEEPARPGPNLPTRPGLLDRVLPLRRGAPKEHALGERERRGGTPEEAVRRDREPAIRRAAGRAGDVRRPGEADRAGLQGASAPLDPRGGRTHAALEES